MVNIFIAVLVMVFLLLLYGTLALFTDYVKAAPFTKILFLNAVWFLVSTGYKEYDIYYPSVFDNKWLNFIMMTVAFMLLAFEISRFTKLRNAFVVSVGAASHLVIAILILNFCGEIPGWATAIYLTVSSCIVLGIHITAIYGRFNADAGNFFSRLMAGILLMPAPFLITAACMLSAATDKKSVIHAVPFKEFINRLYEFLKNAEFQFKGSLIFDPTAFTRKMFIVSLIVAFVFLIIYLIADSTVDLRSDMKEKSKHRKAAEKERIRAEISSRIYAQLEKIDSCMAYLSSNYKVLKIKEQDMQRLRSLYDEATRIKYSYNGAVSGDILKRLTEIKTEIFMMRDRIVNHIDFGEEEQSSQYYGDPFGDSENATGENSGENKESSHEEIKPVTESEITMYSYFNGCKTEEEIKKRYRDLCKVFHPDSGNGDPETFLRVKADYEALMARYVKEA